jgi:biotin carboxyl carrier protein
MEMSEMEKLIELVKGSRLRELTLRNGDSRLTLKKSGLDIGVDIGGELVPYQLQSEHEDSGAPGAVYAYSDPVAVITVQEDIQAVTAPLVGIFHHVKPMIGPGTHVSEGQVVAVIEAMNLITEVTSPTNGIVSETVIRDGMPAEYGQPLFLVRAEP